MSVEILTCLCHNTHQLDVLGLGPSALDFCSLRAKISRSATKRLPRHQNPTGARITTETNMFRNLFAVAGLLLIGQSLIADGDAPVRVLIRTDAGDIEVELDTAKAPNTVANFLKYIDGKFYDGGRFHRTVTPDN